MRDLLALLLCLLCLHGMQGVLGAAVGTDSLLLGLQAALARSPPKTPATKRLVSSDDADQVAWPKEVLLGAGLSAAQAEGAYNEDGKGMSLLDYKSSIPGAFSTDMHVAADHYHRFREDLHLAKQMKFTSHRFSIAWSRVLPTGGVDNINEKGVKFYKDYIDEVIKNGMVPMVTMLHFDQPYVVEDVTGGWGSPEMIDRYVEYADFLFKTFGEKVKYWNTINEPNMYCHYFRNKKNTTNPQEEPYYPCMHNIIIAHAKTYRLYKNKYQAKQKGKVGTSVVMWPATPKTTRSEDVMASETFNQLFAGTLVHPLVFGDYHPLLRYLVDKHDAEEGVTTPRLPELTTEEKQLLAGGTTDFIALNVYSKCTASYNHNQTSSAQESVLLGPVMRDMPFVEVTGIGDFSATEESLMQDALMWTWSNYHTPIIISENGYGDSQHLGVKDTARAAYLSVNLRTLARTIKEYDVEVLAYYVWALMDVWEFTAGYLERPFGLIHVDYENGSLNRTLKDSAKFFIELGTSGIVPSVPAPENGGISSSSTSVTATGLLLSALWLAIRPMT
ncbi:myrosinase 1-like [Frankliniella occidentalis]|uniref:Myrosinase 1-like n=1 Tax=Frankliniella occidentalis TaxID=133901 RepID=A0A9C6XRN3_FRAOC|nr:myrosinase 1-like [Frankliniella occidentalis]